MAKDLVRNRIHTYHSGDSEIAQRRGEMQWVNRSTLALDANRFCLYAQAIESLDGSNQRHYELLLRKLDEQGDIIFPGAFLPAVDRYGLIEKVETWVIKNALDLLSSNPEFLKAIDFVTINLLGPSFTNGALLSSIGTQLIE